MYTASETKNKTTLIKFVSRDIRSLYNTTQEQYEPITAYRRQLHKDEC